MGDPPPLSHKDDRYECRLDRNEDKEEQGEEENLAVDSKPINTRTQTDNYTERRKQQKKLKSGRELIGEATKETLSPAAPRYG